MKKIILTGLFLVLSIFLVIAQEKPLIKKDSVRTAKDTSARILNEVKISSRYYRRYNINKSSVSLKLKTPLLQLPQNIQEIDQSIIADQQAMRS